MLIFRQEVAITRLKNVFDIESFIQEIHEQVFMNWDTDSFIDFLFFIFFCSNEYIYF